MAFCGSGFENVAVKLHQVFWRAISLSGELTVTTDGKVVCWGHFAPKIWRKADWKLFIWSLCKVEIQKLFVLETFLFAYFVLARSKSISRSKNSPKVFLTLQGCNNSFYFSKIRKHLKVTKSSNKSVIRKSTIQNWKHLFLLFESQRWRNTIIKKIYSLARKENAWFLQT